MILFKPQAFIFLFLYIIQMATNLFGNFVRASQQLATNLLVPLSGSNVMKLGRVPEHCFEVTKLKVCNMYQSKKLEIPTIGLNPGLVVSTTTAPVIIFPVGSIARTNMVLALPSDPECSAEVVLINGSVNSQVFDNVEGVSNVKGPNFTVTPGQSFKMVWNPLDNLWYAIPTLGA
jgi:hypothetical protein